MHRRGRLSRNSAPNILPKSKSDPGQKTRVSVPPLDMGLILPGHRDDDDDNDDNDSDDDSSATATHRGLRSRIVRFGKVSVRNHLYEQGGCCSVPEFGGCPLGIAWTHEWEEEHAVDNYEERRSSQDGRSNAANIRPIRPDLRLRLLTASRLEAQGHAVDCDRHHGLIYHDAHRTSTSPPPGQELARSSSESALSKMMTRLLRRKKTPPPSPPSPVPGALIPYALEQNAVEQVLLSARRHSDESDAIRASRNENNRGCECAGPCDADHCPCHAGGDVCSRRICVCCLEKCSNRYETPSLRCTQQNLQPR